jgi:hypothetical protein
VSLQWVTLYILVQFSKGVRMFHVVHEDYADAIGNICCVMKSRSVRGKFSLTCEYHPFLSASIHSNGFIIHSLVVKTDALPAICMETFLIFSPFYDSCCKLSTFVGQVFHVWYTLTVVLFITCVNLSTVTTLKMWACLTSFKFYVLQNICTGFHITDFTGASKYPNCHRNCSERIEITLFWYSTLGWTYSVNIMLM